MEAESQSNLKLATSHSQGRKVTERHNAKGLQECSGGKTKDETLDNLQDFQGWERH